MSIWLLILTLRSCIELQCLALPDDALHMALDPTTGVEAPLGVISPQKSRRPPRNAVDALETDVDGGSSSGASVPQKGRDAFAAIDANAAVYPFAKARAEATAETAYADKTVHSDEISHVEEPAKSDVAAQMTEELSPAVKLKQSRKPTADELEGAKRLMGNQSSTLSGAKTPAETDVGASRDHAAKSNKMVAPVGDLLPAKIFNYSRNCFDEHRCALNLVDGNTCYWDDPILEVQAGMQKLWDALWPVEHLGDVWVEFDLGEELAVKSVVLFGQNEQVDCGRDAIGWDLLYFDNGSATYLDALSVTNTYDESTAGPSTCQQVTYEEECPNPTVRTHFIHSAAPSRYWKLVIKEAFPTAAYAGLMEVEFYGGSWDADIYPVILRNYSLNCIADGRCAPNMIDGDFCGDGSYGAAATNPVDAVWPIRETGKAWMIFDLITPVRLSSIVLYAHKEVAQCKSEVVAFSLLYHSSPLAKHDSHGWKVALKANDSQRRCFDWVSESCPTTSHAYFINGGFVAPLWRLVITDAHTNSTAFFGFMEIKFQGMRVLDPEITPVSIADDSANCVSDARCSHNLIDGQTCFDPQVALDALWTDRHLGWAWIIFDLKKPYMVTTLVTYGQNEVPFCQNDATGFFLEFEKHGRYRTAVTVTDIYSDVTSKTRTCQQISDCACPNPSRHYTYIPGNFISQFWKLTITGSYNSTSPVNSHFGLMEVKFLGKEHNGTHAK